MCWSHARARIVWLESACPRSRLTCSNLVTNGLIRNGHNGHSVPCVYDLGRGGQNVEVEMKIRGLMMDPMTNMPIVVLKDSTGDAVLPIWVGIYEANAIALEIEKVTTPRPMTHDLIKILLMGLEASITKVVVSELKDDTFYALIWLEREGKLMSVDSRPSDALALALRHDCPIYVEDRVLQSSRTSSSASEKVNNEELRKWLENLNDEDLGRYKM
jgi:bifunctional DNase/RNase